MMTTRTLIRLAKKWQKAAVQSRRRITLPKSASNIDEDSCTTSPKAKKGHFVVYTADNRRFVIPLAFLQDEMFTDLLEAAEEQFGLPREGPISLPCSSYFLEHALSLIQRDAAEDLKKALAMTMINDQWFSSSQLSQEQRSSCRTPVPSY